MTIDFTKPWMDQTFVAFDTETSGKYPLLAEICEVAAVKWKGGKIVDRFQTFCKPRLPMTEQVIAIHKITNEMVASAPSIQEVLPRFRDFISDAVLIAHHAPFDLGFLAVEFEKVAQELPKSSSVCSCLLAQKVFPKMINHRLRTLVDHFGIDPGQAHRALDDSRSCMEVAFKCFEQIDRNMISSGQLKEGDHCTLEKIFQTQGGALQWGSYSMKDLEKQEPFSGIVTAARQQLVVEIVYQGGSQPGTPRRVTALGLVRNPLGDYFVGLCHRENTEKRFYLNRISSAKILD